MKKLFTVLLLLLACLALFCACNDGEQPPAPHTHTLTHHAAVAKTCTAAGNVEYWECTDCDKYFSDANATTEITDKTSVVIAASHALTHHTAVAKTCTAAGNIEYWECDGCDKYFSDATASAEITDKTSVVIAASHALTHHIAVAKDCTTAGNVEYWECDDCDTYFSDADAASEITDKSSVVIDASHVLTHHTAVAKDCTTAGNIEYWECTNCDKYFADTNAVNEITDKTSVVIAASHDLTHHAAVAKTCSTAGNIEYWECTECEKYYSDAAGTSEITDKSSVILPAHDLDSNDYCATCGYQKGTEGLVYREYDTYAEVTGAGTASGDVKIASTYNGKPVTRIAYTAFYNCSGLTSITIPSSVTLINSSAFNLCSELVSITVAGGNTVYYSTNNCLIEIATKTLVLGCKSSVIPTDGSVTAIGANAFYGCTGLTSITIPSSVMSVGYDAFYGCTGALQVVNGVSYVDKWAVYCDVSVTDMTLRAGTVGISSCAFQARAAITSLTLPSSVMYIGNSAFYNCIHLASVTFDGESSLIRIDDWAFYRCIELEEIELPASLTAIGANAFDGCTALSSVTFGNTTGWQALWNASNAYGVDVNVSSPSDSASHLTGMYKSYYWKRV